jgi:hypothetical protein
MYDRDGSRLNIKKNIQQTEITNLVLKVFYLCESFLL